MPRLSANSSAPAAPATPGARVASALLAAAVLLSAGRLIYRRTLPTRLLDAARDGNSAEVTALLKQGISPSTADRPNGPTPLGMAVSGGSVATTRLLLRAGAPPSNMLIWNALQFHRYELADTLLNAAPFRDDSVDISSMVVEFAGLGDVRAVKLLLKAGARSDALDLSKNMTPLMAAARYNQPEMVRFLISQGARPNSRTRTGTTALSLALHNGHPAIAALLRHAGAK